MIGCAFNWVKSIKLGCVVFRIKKIVIKKKDLINKLNVFSLGFFFFKISYSKLFFIGLYFMESLRI